MMAKKYLFAISLICFFFTFGQTTESFNTSQICFDVIQKDDGHYVAASVRTFEIKGGQINNFDVASLNTIFQSKDLTLYGGRELSFSSVIDTLHNDYTSSSITSAKPLGSVSAIHELSTGELCYSMVVTYGC